MKARTAPEVLGLALRGPPPGIGLPLRSSLVQPRRVVGLILGPSRPTVSEFNGGGDFRLNTSSTVVVASGEFDAWRGTDFG